MANPDVRFSGGEHRDTVKVTNDYEESGKYMLTDKFGNGLTWVDVKHGMIVKIKAKRVNYPGVEYLQPVKSGNSFSRIRY